MLRYYYINREWIVSESAQRVYRVAAYLSLMLFFLVVFLSIQLQIASKISTVLIPAIKLLLLAGILGAATTTVAMEYFLFGFDTSSAWKKLLWFCVMIVPPLGPALYYFVIYSRSDALKANPKHLLKTSETGKTGEGARFSTFAN